MNNGTGIQLGPKVAGQYQYLSKTFPGRWYNCTYAEAQKAFADQYAIQVLVPDVAPVGKHVMEGVEMDDGGSRRCLGCNQYVYGSLTELPPGECPTPYKSPKRLLAESVARETALREELESLKHWRDLALQFDKHRMDALWHLKALIGDATHAAKATEFLSAPPLVAHEIVARLTTAEQRNTELAAEVARRDALLGELGCPFDPVSDLYPKPAEEGANHE